MLWVVLYVEYLLEALLYYLHCCHYSSSCRDAEKKMSCFLISSKCSSSVSTGVDNHWFHVYVWAYFYPTREFSKSFLRLCRILIVSCIVLCVAFHG